MLFLVMEATWSCSLVLLTMLRAPAVLSRYRPASELLAETSLSIQATAFLARAVMFKSLQAAGQCLAAALLSQLVLVLAA
jgi:hypothetical protein